MLVSCVVVSFNLKADGPIISLRASCQLLLILPTSRSRTYLQQNICTHQSHLRANIWILQSCVTAFFFIICALYDLFVLFWLLLCVSLLIRVQKGGLRVVIHSRDKAQGVPSCFPSEVSAGAALVLLPCFISPFGLGAAEQEVRTLPGGAVECLSTNPIAILFI